MLHNFKSFVLAACCLAGAMSFSACDNGATNSHEEASEVATTAATDSTLTDDKKELMDFAARNNMLQLELGKIATQKGTTDAMKQYGQQLTEIYNNKQKELQELAQQFNTTVPQGLSDDQREYIEEIQNAEAGEFNEKYWDSVVDAQQEALDKFNAAVKDIDQANANAFSFWARNTAKELQAQMEQAARTKAQVNE